MHLTPGELGTQIIGPRLGLRDGGCGLGADDLAVLADGRASPPICARCKSTC